MLTDLAPLFLLWVLGWTGIAIAVALVVGAWRLIAARGRRPRDSHPAMTSGRSRRTAFAQIVEFTARPGNGDEFARVLGIACEATRRERGCIRFDLHRLADDDHRFTLVEIFRREADVHAHRRLPHYTRCMQDLGPLTLGTRTKTAVVPVSIGA